MNLSIRTITNNNIEYKALFVNNIAVPKSSLLDKQLSNDDAYKKWITEDIDTIIKANILKKINKFEHLSMTLPMDMWLALYLESPEQEWKFKLHNTTISDTIFPTHWNITNVVQLKKLITEIGDPSYFYSYLAARNPNALIQNNGSPNKIAMSKGTVTELKTKNIDSLAWTTSFIHTNKKIEALRETYQLQKTDSGWKTRKFSHIEDVEYHIERELLPLRHKAYTDDKTVDEIIENLRILNIPIEILMTKELDGARNKNTLSLKLIEHGLNVSWAQIELQVFLLKEKNVDNADIIKELQLSTAQIEISGDTTNVEMPFF